MRMFLALNFDKEALRKINNLLLSLRKSGIKGNYTNSNNLHLTLLFLGEIDTEKMQEVMRIMDKITFESFSININKISKMKDILIMNVEKSEKLLSLQNIILKEIEKTDINFDKKAFLPHVTLVRECFSNIEKDINIQSFVESFILFSSERIDGKLTYINRYERRFK